MRVPLPVQSISEDPPPRVAWQWACVPRLDAGRSTWNDFLGSG
ncbi:hypothetical protein FHR80_004161 [Cellulomonas cellasea]|uniref:Uncharacterized protein n=1 Tax=Cellulomonas cellasea TaxID=43670 RepID=A0A7W4UJA4_9CELL|nr:hypothetical protein [Cellulomonas cellasea]